VSVYVCVCGTTLKVDVRRLKYYYMEDDGGGLMISRVHPQVKAAVTKVKRLTTLRTDSGFLTDSDQWWNYGGARGGLAHLKDLAAPRNICFERVQGGLQKAHLKLQDDHPSIRHCNMSF